MWYSRCKGSHACTKEHAETVFNVFTMCKFTCIDTPLHLTCSILCRAVGHTVILTYDRANVLT